MTFTFSYTQHEVKLTISTEYISQQIDDLFTLLESSGVYSIYLDKFDFENELIYDHMMNCVTRHPKLFFEAKNYAFYEDDSLFVRAGWYPINPSEIDDIRLLTTTESITTESLTRLARSFPGLTSLVIDSGNSDDITYLAQSINLFPKLGYLSFNAIGKGEGRRFNSTNVLDLYKQVNLVSIFHNGARVADCEGIHQPEKLYYSEKLEELKAYIEDMNNPADNKIMDEFVESKTCVKDDPVLGCH